MSEIDDGGPAFPVQSSQGLGQLCDGMSLRDYFAAKAMQGMLPNPNLGHATEDRPLTADEFATGAYAMADAMLRARQASTPGE